MRLARRFCLRKIMFCLLLTGWLVLFVLLTHYTDSETNSVKVPSTALTRRTRDSDDVSPHYDLYKHADLLTFKGVQRKSVKVERRVLLVHRMSLKKHPKVAHHITKYLDGLRIPYIISKIDERPFMDLKSFINPSVVSGKYSVISFLDIKTYLELKPNTKQILRIYCKKFDVGQLLFTTTHVGFIPEFQIDIQKPLKVRTIQTVCLNESSPILRLTRNGGEIQRPSSHHEKSTRWSFMSFSPSDVPYETVEYVIREDKRSGRNLHRRLGSSVGATVVLDDGRRDGVKRVFFGGGFPFFLHIMLLLDSLDYLSPVFMTHALERYLQIDIDDIFIARTGIRMKRKDVQDLLSAQELLEQKIPGFKFNLGFSGKGYLQGNEDEDDGDQAILENANKFTWFGHLFDHEQPHKLSLKQLTRSMIRNKKFAVDHGIPMSKTYAVAPHHSGVYPVHESLYEAWRRVHNISITSTEEYPHLKPPHLRRGFMYRGVKVLPRQTCGLFTTTNFFNQLKGGNKRLLDKSIEGGELFETVLRNPVVIVMTHMTNYANDQLALYAITRLVNFVHSWTNIELRYGTPTKLADIYFNLFPKDKQPSWQSPCDDDRHLTIWSKDKSCSRLPSFLAIEPPHGGLGLLQSLLQLHPGILSMRSVNNSVCETHFFSSDNYMKGLDWYLQFFPVPQNADQVSYEVSSSYFTSREAPFRANSLFKSGKIIIVLQEPSNRAHAHYMHLRRQRHPIAGRVSFEELVEAEKNSRFSKLRSQILWPGHYAEHIARWMKYYDPKKMLIVNVDDLIHRTPEVIENIQEFVSVEQPVDYSTLLRYDKEHHLYCPSGSNSTISCYGYGLKQDTSMTEPARSYLQRYYSKHNRNLFRINQKIQFSLPKWLRDYG